LKFSVIIPAYNAERYIAQAIKSCLNQTYPPHEIIVVDDASTDGTAAVAESFPSPVRLIRLTENLGVSVARNRGVEASTGDWIAFLDADDWFLPEKLERQQCCALENKEAVLIYTAARILAADGSQRDGRFVTPTKLWPLLRYRNPIFLSTAVVRRDAFDAVGGFDPSLRNGQDWDLWLRIAARYSVGKFAAMPEPLAFYRQLAGSLSSSAMRSFPHHAEICASSSLLGTAGLSRLVWRLRISAFLYYDLSIALREEGSLHDLAFILKSIAFWPFPWSEMPMKRYKVAAVMVKQHFFRRLSRLGSRG
jgi:glycosyltransferase involved in cell wall biosynthesis